MVPTKSFIHWPLSGRKACIVSPRCWKLIVTDPAITSDMCVAVKPTPQLLFVQDSHENSIDHPLA